MIIFDDIEKVLANVSIQIYKEMLLRIVIKMASHYVTSRGLLSSKSIAIAMAFFQVAVIRKQIIISSFHSLIEGCLTRLTYDKYKITNFCSISKIY